MMQVDRRYAFRWDLLGDIDQGRPNLGRFANLEVYRLMQYTLRDVLEQRLGTQTADEIFQEAGHLAGREFFAHAIHPVTDFNDFARRTQAVMREMGMGILRFEEVDLQAGELVLTMAEDLDCSGLPELEFEFCAYDEGFLSGLLESYLGAPFHVKEIDCWCSGDRTCRFRAVMAQ